MHVTGILLGRTASELKNPQRWVLGHSSASAHFFYHFFYHFFESVRLPLPFSIPSPYSYHSSRGRAAQVESREEMGSGISGMNAQYLTQTLVESFNALADEVQNLSDRQTILEHKLRYAREQVRLMLIV